MQRDFFKRQNKLYSDLTASASEVLLAIHSFKEQLCTGRNIDMLLSRQFQTGIYVELREATNSFGSKSYIGLLRLWNGKCTFSM